MRIAGWIFVLCALLGAASMFLPSVELQVGGVAVSRRTSLSVYQASSNRELAARAFAGYRRSSARPFGYALVSAMMPHTPSRVRGYLGDVRDAMSTLDELREDDVKTAGTVLTIVLWAFLLLQLIAGGLVLGEAQRPGAARTGRIITALVIAVVLAAVAVGIRLGLTEAVWQANDEVGRPLFALSTAATTLPAAAIAGVVALVAMLGLQLRARAVRASG